MICHSAPRHRQSCHESTKQSCLLCSNRCPIRSGSALAVCTASSARRALMPDTHESRCCWEKVPRLPRLCSSYELISHSPGGAMSFEPYVRFFKPDTSLLFILLNVEMPKIAIVRARSWYICGVLSPYTTRLSVSAKACMSVTYSPLVAEMTPHARSMGAHAVGQSVDLLQEPYLAMIQPNSAATL